MNDPLRLCLCFLPKTMGPKKSSCRFFTAPSQTHTPKRREDGGKKSLPVLHTIRVPCRLSCGVLYRALTLSSVLCKMTVCVLVSCPCYSHPRFASALLFFFFRLVSPPPFFGFFWFVSNVCPRCFDAAQMRCCKTKAVKDTNQKEKPQEKKACFSFVAVCLLVPAVLLP